MNDSDLMPDDPRLTAYALGELEGDERAAVEAAVRARPELRAAVEEIRAVAAQMEAALATEPIELAPAEAQWRDAAAVDRPLRLPLGRERQGGGKLIRFPQFYYVAGGLAAAALAVMVAWNRDEYAVREAARVEQLRVAMEKRAAEARAVAPTMPAIVVTSVQPTEPERPVEPVVEPATNVELPTAKETLATGSLALLQQVQRERTSGDEAAPANLVLAKATPTPPAEVVAAADETVSRTLIEKTVERTAAPSEAVLVSATATPSVPVATAEPVYTTTLATELFPGTPRVFAPPATSSTPGMRYAQVPANSEIVLLEAFTVNAERVSFGATSPLRRRSYDSYGEDRDPRPPAPTGARFGRPTTGEVRDNDFVSAKQEPRSTFAADTDAASYAVVRRALAQREMPSREAVKIEELVNYFPYRYAGPPEERKLSFFEKLRGEDGAPPFAAALEVAEAPWAPQHRLVRIGLKGREMLPAERPAANLVFLIDVSNSMNEPNKLPLVKESLRLLVNRLRADDRVAIVTYAGKSGLVLPSTPVERIRDVLGAIDSLTPQPPTTGSTGLRLAYEVARERFAEDGINRVILCTDGDFGLGAASESELFRLVDERAGSGVFLSVLGFGMGSYRDQVLEQLAWRGNGSYGYIDSRREAQKLLVEQVSSTLVTIAKDVKIQVEFNPAQVAQYRLIGYENRLLRKEDFNSDQIDGGEIGAGHTLTALYEVVPAAPGRPVSAAASWRGGGDELLTVTVRYKKPAGIFSRKSEYKLVDTGRGFAAASADFRFAAAVAQFGMLLRQSPHRGRATIGEVIAWAAAAAVHPADDPGGYRGEFIDLARQAQEMWRSE